MFLRVYNSVNLKLGRDDSTNLQSKNCDGASGAIYTGDVEVNANTTYSSDGVFYVHVTDPYPFILLSMVSQLTANE